LLRGRFHERDHGVRSTAVTPGSIRAFISSFGGGRPLTITAPTLTFPAGMALAVSPRGVTAMLRIMTTQQAATYRLELHGTIAGEWIAVLEHHWRDILNAVPSATIAVGLSNVVFIDREGEELLRQMAERGVKLDGAGLMNRYVIGKISGGM
jgi:hypothetical protein